MNDALKPIKPHDVEAVIKQISVETMKEIEAYYNRAAVHSCFDAKDHLIFPAQPDAVIKMMKELMVVAFMDGYIEGWNDAVEQI